ncbi:hypothetical protein [Halomicrococcus sp. NG-SE-24]|uniref:hypothetical protein n=1 Tax=Halomicrococcus sp. NG-SE-24 TaxID=3436928 RepID=UPI003D953C21
MLANGETTIEELHLKVDPDTSIGEYEPDSYYLTVTPDDLAEPGPELDWETLRDAVENPEDGGYWNDTLEIHESRVGEDVLKASHRPAARILSGLARSQAYENGVVPRETIDDLVDTYCLHLTNRVADAEQERGKEHIRETYTDLITDQLYENPSPTADSYYCSTDTLQTRLQTELDTAQSVAERADMSPTSTPGNRLTPTTTMRPTSCARSGSVISPAGSPISLAQSTPDVRTLLNSVVVTTKSTTPMKV